MLSTCSFRYAILALSLLGVHLHTVADAWKVLVLGGSGFTGHLTTERLLREGHDVTVLSRGNSYWGIVESFQGRATLWKCNRTISTDFGGAKQSSSSGLVNCSNLTSSSSFFDAVVDFSSSRSLEELRQAIGILKERVGVWIFISTHAVYDVSRNSTHGEPFSFESDAVRPGREVSPLDRFELKGKNEKGDIAMECEDELLKHFNTGGFPFVTLRLANVIGPKENTIRYWLLHLWVRAHRALTMPMQLDESLLNTPISLTYTPDIAQAVVRAIARSRGEVCCPEHVHGEAFNLACEQTPTQNRFYELIAEPIGEPFIETQEVRTKKAIVLYPDVLRGPVSAAKAMDVLRWSPTDLAKAMRSVARFYDRVMLDKHKYKREYKLMYDKCKRMLGKDGPILMEWITKYYDERRKTELYDELDDEDEDDILLSRPDPERSKKSKRKQKRKKASEL